MRGRTSSVRGDRPKTNLLDLIETTTDKLGRDLGLIEDNTIMPEVGSQAYEQIRVTKLMNEDVVSQHNEPLTPLETLEEIEFEPKLEETKEKPGNSQNPIKIVPPKPKVDQFKRMEKMLEEGQKQQEQKVAVDELDIVSQSSTSSRAESFKRSGFGSLIKNEEDEHELDNFFVAERHYLVLTNAGKPVYSM